MSGPVFLTKRVDTLVYTTASKLLIPKHQPKPQLKKQALSTQMRQSKVIRDERHKSLGLR